MTPSSYEQIERLQKLSKATKGIDQVTSPMDREAIGALVEAITQLQEQKHGLEQYIEGQKLDIQGLQEQVTELENHNADKSQLLANYKEQITSLVKEKHRREE